ncbi:MAG: DUF4238 domain-containing protein, partial [Gammaproteobacteria bacterium]
IRHISDQWRGPLKKMGNLAKQLEKATEEEKKELVNFSRFPGSNDGKSFSHDQVREMVDDPVKTMLIPMIETVAPLLSKLDFAILCNDLDLGNITSDSPCVWFDPEAYKRPPIYRGPALMYDTIEITLPVTPKECIYLNRQGMRGFIDVPEAVVRDLNRRTRFQASEYYVVNQDRVDDIWFDPGIEPDDSWEKDHAKQEANNTPNLDAQ